MNKIVDDDTFTHVNKVLSLILRDAPEKLKSIITECANRNDVAVCLDLFKPNIFLYEKSYLDCLDECDNDASKVLECILNDQLVANAQQNIEEERKKSRKKTIINASMSGDSPASPSDFDRISVGTISLNYKLQIDEQPLISFIMTHYINDCNLRKVELDYVWAMEPMEPSQTISDCTDTVSVDVSAMQIPYHQDFFYFFVKELPFILFKPSKVNMKGGLSFVFENWLVSKFI